MNIIVERRKGTSGVIKQILLKNQIQIRKIHDQKYKSKNSKYSSKSEVLEKVNKVIEKYLDGYSLNDLAKEFEYSYNLIRDILIVNNISIRTKHLDRVTDRVKSKLRKASTGKKHSEESKKRISDRNHERLYHIDGKQLKLWREQNNLSRKDLAKWIECNRTTVQGWELGRASMSRTSYLKFINVFKFDPTQKFKVVE